MKVFVASLLLALAVVGSAQSSPTERKYYNQDLGLLFNYPSSWEVTVNKGNAKFAIPVGTKMAQLEIIPLSFKLESEKWQDLQTKVNSDLKRELVRQWQEEILGVPLLMTQVRYSRGSEPVNTLTGLLYSASPKKLNFRLTAATDIYEEAERQWRSVLQSLATVSGEVPTKEDPASPTAKTPAKNPPKPPKPPVAIGSDKKRTKYKIGEVAVQAKTAGRDVVLHLPEGWRAEGSGDSFNLTNAKLGGKVTVNVSSTLDSAKPEVAFIRENGRTLSAFTKVTKRIDMAPRINRAGSKIVAAWRTGAGASAPMGSWVAVGESDEFYWVLSYEGAGEKVFEKDRDLIWNLIEGTSIQK